MNAADVRKLLASHDVDPALWSRLSETLEQHERVVDLMDRPEAVMHHDQDEIFMSSDLSKQFAYFIAGEQQRTRTVVSHESAEHVLAETFRSVNGHQVQLPSSRSARRYDMLVQSPIHGLFGLSVKSASVSSSYARRQLKLRMTRSGDGDWADCKTKALNLIKETISSHIRSDDHTRATTDIALVTAQRSDDSVLYQLEYLNGATLAEHVDALTVDDIELFTTSRGIRHARVKLQNLGEIDITSSGSRIFLNLNGPDRNPHLTLCSAVRIPSPERQALEPA